MYLIVKWETFAACWQLHRRIYVESDVAIRRCTLLTYLRRGCFIRCSSVRQRHDHPLNDGQWRRTWTKSDGRRFPNVRNPRLCLPPLLCLLARFFPRPRGEAWILCSFCSHFHEVLWMFMSLRSGGLYRDICSWIWCGDAAGTRLFLLLAFLLHASTLCSRGSVC